MPYSSKQAKVMLEADARWNLLVGAVRSGKTWVSYDLILQRLIELPDGDRVLIGRTQQTLERNVLNPLRRKLGGHYVTHVNNKNTCYIAGKPYYVTGADNKEAVTKIQGLGLVYGYGDEITTWHEDVFQMLKSRLSDTGAQFDGTCNPANPQHWLKTDILDNEKIDVKSWHFHIDDNPFLDPVFVADLKKEYSGMWYRRYILGEWCLAEGLVYPNFDHDAHVTSDIPQLRSISISVDVGQSNATVFLATGEGIDNRLYCLDEYYHSGKKTGETKSPLAYAKDFEKWLIELLADYPGMQVSDIWIDPSALGFKAQLRDMGYIISSADNDVVPGIQTVSSLIDADLLRVHPRCKNLLDELRTYSWDSKASERGEDKPLKENDHVCDALRYRVFSRRRDWIGRIPNDGWRETA